MTRKEAIEYLINWDKALESQGDSPFSDARRALSYGIHSLETDEAYQLEYESTTKNDLGVDAISRDEVCRYVAEFVNHEFSTREEEELIDNIITGIERMPSVTPQLSSELDKTRKELEKEQEAADGKD